MGVMSNLIEEMALTDPAHAMFILFKEAGVFHWRGVGIAGM
jgi:hypothetical protein